MNKYMTINNKKPENLMGLLRRAAPIIWKGKAAEKTMCRNVEEAAEIMGNPKLSDINTSLLDQYKMVLASHLAPGTVNYKMVNLHRILKFGYEREWIERMPKFEYMTVHNERERVFTEEEINGVLSWLRDNNKNEAADFFEILALTGMRFSELYKATSDQIQGNWLVLKAKDTKTKKSRRVPLNDRALALLKDRMPFTLSKSGLRLHWDAARDALGFKDDKEFIPHVLRHTKATMALSKTRNLAVVQKLLGHSSVKTTQRYAKVLDDDLMDAVM
jgi:integrase